MRFEDFNLDENILKGIKKAGFVQCTDVQAETLKYTLEGKDILVQSQTGTGKTAAFMIPLYHLLINNEKMKNKKALILAPTRELALQIEKEGKLLASFINIKIGCFYGGVGYNQQEKLLKDGVDIYVATPGRLMDFASNGKIKYSEFGIIIIDEADRMFDMGFFPDVKKIMKKMVSSSERISMLFSATLSTKVKNLAWEFMNDPVEVNISEDQVTVDKIKQLLYHVGTKDKINLLLGILKNENPQSTLIFTNTKQEAVRVAAKLAGNNFECNYIIGDLPQNKRTKVIENIKSGKLKHLVATDVAARGLHINDLDLVINFDIPEDYENYVHRIGRTARAGKTGKAVTFACEKFVYGLEAIESFIKMKIPVEWPDDEMFAKDESSDEFIRSYLKESKQARILFESDEPENKKGEKSKSAKKAKNKQQTNKKKTTGDFTDIDNTTSGKNKNRVKQNNKDHENYLNKEQTNPKKEKRSKNLSLDERIDYYKKTYGENFTVKNEIKATKKKKTKSKNKSYQKTPVKKLSLIDRIKSFFKKK
ncbi:MAG: DEAD/DEAH box helicase [Spirochaetes bacterium]|nr:DEAD/DEAH box helicase [Spirochaetota bacterium]